ncbi:MAG: hypothetical protein JST54_20305 [Deltaproteobacteria bacterium]|nr:hypothetical protein [Deltaproteobacteria bacterium]
MSTQATIARGALAAELAVATFVAVYFASWLDHGTWTLAQWAKDAALQAAVAQVVAVPAGVAATFGATRIRTLRPLKILGFAAVAGFGAHFAVDAAMGGRPLDLSTALQNVQFFLLPALVAGLAILWIAPPDRG